MEVPTSFHYATDTINIGSVRLRQQIDRFAYTFQNYFHPFVGQLIAQLNATSVAGMLDPAFLENLIAQAAMPDFFTSDYSIPSSKTVSIEHFPKTIDVTVGGP